MYYNYTLYQPKNVIQDIKKLNSALRYFSNGDVKTTPLTKVGDAFDSWQAENTAARKAKKKDTSPRRTTTPINVRSVGEGDEIPVRTEASKFGPLVQAEPVPTARSPRRYATAVGLPLLAVGAGILGLSFFTPAKPGTTATPTIFSGGKVLSVSTQQPSGSSSNTNTSSDTATKPTPQPLSSMNTPMYSARSQTSPAPASAPATLGQQPQATTPAPAAPTVSTSPTPSPTPAPTPIPAPITGGVIQDVVPVVNAIQTDVQNITSNAVTLP